jgi:predicted chitinase
MAKRVSKKTRSVVDIIGASNREVSKNIELMSSQISELTNLIIEERRIKEDQERKQRSFDRKVTKQSVNQKAISLAYENELQELSSERRSISAKINALLDEEKKIQTEEKKKSDERARAFSSESEKAYASGDFVSGLFLSFLGRNEPSKKEQEKENTKLAAVEREKLLGELEKQREELKEQQKTLRSELKTELKDGFSSFNKSYVKIAEDQRYELRDAADDASKESIIPKILDVNVVSIDRKILDKFTSTREQDPLLPIGSLGLLKPVADTLSKTLPFLKTLAGAEISTSLLAISGGLAGAAASWSLFFKGLNDEQEAYNLRRERERKSKEEAAIADTNKKSQVARNTAEVQVKQIESQGRTANSEVLKEVAQQYKEEGKTDLSYAMMEKAREAESKEITKTTQIAKESPTRVFTTLVKEGAVQYNLPENYTIEDVRDGVDTGQLREYYQLYSEKEKKWYRVSDIVGMKPTPKTVEPVLPESINVVSAKPSTVVEEQPITKPSKIISKSRKENIDLMRRELTGKFNEREIAAILGNIEKETGFVRLEENLDYSKTSNKRIREVFGERAKTKSDEELNLIKRDPKLMAEMMYGSGTEIGKKLGNIEPGEGWKYRGRGFIQFTGKNNYAAASKALYGDNRLVVNPDLANDPQIAAQMTVWYAESRGKSIAKQMGIDVETSSQEEINRLYTSAIAGRIIKRDPKSYLGGEILSKVDIASKKLSMPVATPTIITQNTPRTSANVSAAVEDRRLSEQQPITQTNISAPTMTSISNTNLSSVRDRPKETYNPTSSFLDKLFRPIG